MGKFEGVLPYGVNEKWSLRNTIMYLGEPHTKSKHIVEIIYPALGLGLVFKGGWSQEDNLIDYGYFYEKEYESIQCAGCAKNIKRYKLADKVNDDKR